MSKRPNFDWPYIFTELQNLGKAVKQKVTIFVAGGAAMAFSGLKIATKERLGVGGKGWIGLR